MKILLVEDDAGIGRFVNRGLVGRGHEVVWERTASRAWGLVGAGCFDAVLLDLGLRDGDGLDLCRKLRQSDRTPVLMLTARAALQDRLDGFEAGADDYLVKPFAFEELVARLRVIERRIAERAPEPIQFGDLVLDPVLRNVRCAGRPVAISGKAFDLLSHLALAKGAVIDRISLIDAVWGVGADITDNALDVHIGSLRRRLAGTCTTLIVETVRGQGFRLVRHEPGEARQPDF